MQQKIITFLWFDQQAEEAVQLYTSIFDDSRVIDVQRYGEVGPGEEGSVMTIEFELAGQRYLALNGGPEFRFNEAISLYVNCDSQEEVDNYWSKLTADGGQEVQCGWLKDRFGLSWQIVPRVLTELLADPDRARSQRAMKAMLGMKKLDIQALREAAEG
ncbi:VOC family protein [Streptomyces triticirhizae]|uniref:VOC family protein n=1 Tax=Streptomyces triticirhizae TaxID=2483353 RepID=A0A3M2KS45_9ACTN|nr:VOC family protein [Streptomyces triticirhizae]RMI25198.1 VOC family protein [Streptomyces triticirhizae]